MARVIEIVFDVGLVILSVIVGVFIYYLPALKDQPPHLRFLWGFWSASAPFFFFEGIKFYYKSRNIKTIIEKLEGANSIEEKVKKLEETMELFYKDRIGDDLLLFLTEFSEPIRDLIKLERFAENGYAFTQESLREWLNKGVARVNSETSDYIEHLEKTLDSTSSCIYLTCLVPPQWFFTEGDSSLKDEERSHDPIPLVKKQGILEYYEKKRVANCKIRIVIYDNEDIDNMKEENGLQEYRKGAEQLVNANKSITHFWTTEERLRGANKNYIIEDYGIFDGIYFLQYNLKTNVLRAGWHERVLKPRIKIFKDINGLLTNQRLFQTFEELVAFLKNRKII